MKFKITNVSDIESPTLASKKYSYRIGRTCSIDLNTINIGNPLIVIYDDGSYFITSKIEEIKEYYHKFIVKTKNRIYTFLDNEQDI